MRSLALALIAFSVAACKPAADGYTIDLVNLDGTAEAVTVDRLDGDPEFLVCFERSEALIECLVNEGGWVAVPVRVEP